MLSFAPNYGNLPLIAKIEVFEYALENTEGNDLSRVLNLALTSSSVLLAKVTNLEYEIALFLLLGRLCG